MKYNATGWFAGKRQHIRVGTKSECEEAAQLAAIYDRKCAHAEVRNELGKLYIAYWQEHGKLQYIEY
jgi:hypothetical protein